MTQQNQSIRQGQQQQSGSGESALDEEYPHPTRGHSWEVRGSLSQGAVDSVDVPGQIDGFLPGSRDGSFQK